MSSQQVLALISTVGLLIWQFWPSISPLLAKIPWPSGSWFSSKPATAVPADIDVTDLQALKVVQARFIRLNCPEGQAAVKTLFDHYFHVAEVVKA